MIHGFNFNRYNSIYTHHFDFHNTILFLITISIIANIKYVKPHVNQVGLHQLYSMEASASHTTIGLFID